MKEALVKQLPETLYLDIRRHYFRLRQPKKFRSFQELRLSTDASSYSYRPFDENKAIFVHIPKCAGISVNKALFGNLAGGHTTLDQYLLIFSSTEIRNYFKFTLVRNPWDRVVSAYHFLQQGGFGPKDKAWAENMLGKSSDFASFVRGSLTNKSVLSWYHFLPQHHFITDRHDKVKMDFVGYVENIEEDIQYIAQRLNKKISLTQTNKSERSAYMDYYDDETAAIVHDVYRRDVELLGYTFDNSNLTTVIADRNRALAQARPAVNP